MSLESLKRRMEAIPKNVREAVKPALTKSADELVGFMKRLAETSRDTGALIESIQATPGGQSTPAYSQPGGSHLVPENAVTITAGDADVRYAHLVEHGTAKAPAQPFFWVSYRLLKNRIKRRIKSSIKKAVKDGWQ